MNQAQRNLANRLHFHRIGTARTGSLVSWERDISPLSRWWPHRAEAPPYSWMTVTRQLDDGTTYTFRVACSVTWRRDGEKLVPYVSSATVRTPRGTYRTTNGLTMREKRDYLRHVGAIGEDDRNEDDEDEG